MRPFLGECSERFKVYQIGKTFLTCLSNLAFLPRFRPCYMKYFGTLLRVRFEIANKVGIVMPLA